jgi:hypothetical protein
MHPEPLCRTDDRARMAEGLQAADHAAFTHLVRELPA